MNIGFEVIDRHAGNGPAGKTALIWLSQSRDRDARYTYGELLDATQRFGRVLADLGVEKGEHVFAFCGRVPLLYIGALGTLRYGAVFCRCSPLSGRSRSISVLQAAPARCW